MFAISPLSAADEPVPARPQLRLLQGGRSPEPPATRSTPSTLYRRRRVAAAVLVVALVVGAAFGAVAGLQVLGDHHGSGSLTAPAAVASPGAAPVVLPSAVAPGARSLVVREGDTWWGIARQITPAGADVSATVDHLVARNGGVATLQPGMRLALD